MPETEELRWNTHNSIRKTLFFSAFRLIKYTEYRRLSSEDDSFELKTITPWSEGFLDRVIDTYITREKRDGRLVQTQRWEMERESAAGAHALGLYRVKIYHMNNDEFRAKVYP